MKFHLFFVVSLMAPILASATPDRNAMTIQNILKIVSSKIGERGLTVAPPQSFGHITKPCKITAQREKGTMIYTLADFAGKTVSVPVKSEELERTATAKMTDDGIVTYGSLEIRAMDGASEYQIEIEADGGRTDIAFSSSTSKDGLLGGIMKDIDYTQSRLECRFKE